VSDNYTYRGGAWQKITGKKYTVKQVAGAKQPSREQTRDGKPVWAPHLKWRKGEEFRLEGEKVFVKEPWACFCLPGDFMTKHQKRRDELQELARLCYKKNSRDACDTKYPWRLAGWYTGPLSPDSGRLENPRFPGNYDRAHNGETLVEGFIHAPEYKMESSACLAPTMAASGEPEMSKTYNTPMKAAPFAQSGPRGQ